MGDGRVVVGPSFRNLTGQQQRRKRSSHSTTIMLASQLLRQPARLLLSRTTSRSVSRSIFRSPTLPRRRAFHASAPRHNAVDDALLYLPYEMMTLLHTQLPWHVVIPLSAFIMRGVLVVTAGSHARSLAARYIGLQPLRQAMAHQKRHQIMKQSSFFTVSAAKAVISSAVSIETRALDKRWNCTLLGQLNWSLAQLPIFLVMADVIRRMCNAQDGLLSMGLTCLGLKTAAQSFHQVPVITNPWFQPSLANEGMLWFPDLLAPDPTGALPFVVSGLMFFNVYTSKNQPADPNNRPAFSKNLRRVMLGVSLLVGPLCQNLPAALILYWTGSTSSVIVWNWWLDWRYPAPKDGLACKRPLQILPPVPQRRL